MIITDRWGDSLHYEDPVLRAMTRRATAHARLTDRAKVQLAAVLRGQVNRYRVDDVEVTSYSGTGTAFVRVKGADEVELPKADALLLAEALVPQPDTVAPAPEETPPKRKPRRRSSSSSSKRTRAKGKKRVATKSKSKQVAAPKKGTILYHRRSGERVEVLGTTTKTKDGQRRVRLLRESGKETQILPGGIPNNYEA